VEVRLIMEYYRGKGLTYDHGPRFGDSQFINREILKLPVSIQGQVRVRYSEIYQSLEGSHNQRQRANNWLRATVKKRGFIR